MLTLSSRAYKSVVISFLVCVPPLLSEPVTSHTLHLIKNKKILLDECTSKKAGGALEVTGGYKTAGISHWPVFLPASSSGRFVCCQLKTGWSRRWKLSQHRHLAESRQGTNQRLLCRLLASITAAFGLTTAEQVHGGQVSSSTCSYPKPTC